MSLYKDASLVMLPSAVKDGKLYSIRPTDGSGDFTFSRGSNLAATRVDVNGLIEKGRENLVTYSNQFNNWDLDSIGTLTGNQSGYNGNHAWYVVPSNFYGTHIVRKSSDVYQGLQTYSVYAKTAGYDIQLRATGIGGTNFWVSYDLTNGAIGTSGAGKIDATIISVGNGWYRCTMTFEALSGQSPYIGIYIVADGATAPQAQSFIGNGSAVYIQDAQVEKSMVATDYIETGASTAQAGILEDLPRLDYSGGASCPSLLLEPLRTNAVLHSEYFSLGSGYWGNTRCTIEDNSITSPEGAINAAKLLQDSSTTTAGLVNKNITASGTNTFSFFAKKGTRNFARLSLYSSVETSVYFDLENGEIGTTNLIAESDCFIENMGNDWYRCGGTYSGATNRFNIYIGDRDGETSLIDASNAYIYIYGAQLEESKSYPTSYIPTMGSAVTRSGEELNILGNSQIIGQGQGTIFLEASALNDDNTNRVISLSDGTSSNRVLLLYQAGSNTIRSQFSVSGQSSVVIDYIADTTQNRKMAVTWDSTSMNLYVDGVKRSSANTGYTFSVTLDDVRFDNVGGGNFLGKVKQTLLFPTALTDSECIALTTL